MVTVQQEMRFSLDRLSQIAMQATGVNTGSSVFRASGGKLSFAMSDVAVNPTVFFLSGSRMYVSEAVATLSK